MASGTSDPSSNEQHTAVTAVTAPGSGTREFGRYALLERLGSGGMADVFLALANGPFDAKKLVVLKCPRAFDHEYAQMFMDEARLAMRLNHPNVVQTYDVGVHDGSFFLAMEFLEGQALHHLVAAMTRENRWLSHAHLARIVSDALAGLHYAHELCDYDGTPLQIVHRDVSPHNLFVTYDGHVKVVDFGIAKATLNVVSTAAGSVKGKLAYMAPEHAMSGIVDRRADVFAMGIVLWELIARRRLITGVLSSERLNKLLTMEFPPLSAEAPGTHPLLEVVAMRALQRDPRDRYQTAGEMREALEAYIGASAQPVRTTETGGLTATLFASAREEMATRIRGYAKAVAGSSPGAAAPPAEAPPEAETARMPLPATPVSMPVNLPAAAPSPSLGEAATSPTTTAVVTSTSATRTAPSVPSRSVVVALIAVFATLSVVGVALVVLSLVGRGAPAAAHPAAGDAVDGGEAVTATTAMASPTGSATGTGTGTAPPSVSTATQPTAPPSATSAVGGGRTRGPSTRGPRGPGPAARPIDTSFPR